MLDVLLGAMVRGDWQRFEAHVTAGAAYAAEAERTGGWPDAHEIEEAATGFRYARDLLTTEETEAWLAHAGLNLETWLEVLARNLLRARRGVRVAASEDTAPAALAIDEALLAAEGVCSGMFADFARTLAERMAVAEQADGVLDADDITAEVARVRHAHAAWLAGCDPVELEGPLTHLVSVEAVYAAVVAAAVTDTLLSLHLDRHRLEWLRVDLERLTFATAEAAREAAWCVREDGLTLSDVAVESRQPVHDVRALLDSLDEPLRDAVLSAQLDEVVGPVEINGRFAVALVVGKTPPTLADPLVRARAERSIVEALTAKAVLSHVAWVEKPTTW